METCSAILNVLRDVVKPTGSFIPLHEPTFAGNEKAYVDECVDTGWVSSAGKFVDRFEKDLASYTGVKRSVAMSNGTSALHLCLRLAGVDSGHEVLIPALTFVATANAVAYCGAIPHFVESEEQHLGIDPEKLGAYLSEIADKDGEQTINRKTGRPIKALVIMHTFGFPSRIDELKAVADKWDIAFIEDAAESLGSYYKGVHTGNFGLVSAMSYNGNKIVTTGGGGSLLTNDDALADKAKFLSTTAKEPHPYEYVHTEVGYNYRMPNINAALGCGQLETLDEFLKQKRALAKAYINAFEDVDGADFIQEPAGTVSNYWLCALRVNPATLQDVLEKTNKEGIMTRPIWKLMNKLPMYTHCPSMDLDCAEVLESEIINIPSTPKLGLPWM